MSETQIRWRQVWEAELTVRDHEDLRGLLAGIFPLPRDAAHGSATQISWASGRPDLRLIAYAGAEPVAHIAVAPRLVIVDGRPLLVGDTGLVGVRASHRGTGLGLELLARHAAAVRALALPFGFLTCTDPTASFYRRGGWQRLPASVRVTQLSARGITAQTQEPAAMVLAAASPLDAWPAGDIIRNGYEI
jgi:predicted N-acetyltransferase YhbS